MFEDFQRKLNRLTYLEFVSHDRHECLSFGLTEEELRAELKRLPADELFLGRYTEDEIRERLERAGILSRLAELGYADVKMEVSTRDVYNHRLYIYTERRDYDHMLIELRLREGWFRPGEQFVPEYPLGPMPMILVDWLMLQNPRRQFDSERPPLPQQRYPGLGLLSRLIPVVHEVVKETNRYGVLDVPEHYHGALFYSSWFRFYNPEMEGKLAAMKRDLSRYPLHLVSHGFDLHCIFNKKTGREERWTPGEQIMPIASELLNYFEHPGYRARRNRAEEEFSYDLDLRKLETKMKEEKSREAERLPAGERTSR